MPRRTIGLDAIVENCAPWLAGQGFDRNGVFRRFSEAGDCLIVEFQPARTTSEPEAEPGSNTFEQVSTKVTSVLQSAIATFVGFLDRSALLADVRRGNVNAMIVNRRTTAALLLMEHGHSDELKELLDQMRTRSTVQSAFADWIWSNAVDGEQPIA